MHHEICYDIYLIVLQNYLYQSMRPNYASSLIWSTSKRFVKKIILSLGGLVWFMAIVLCFSATSCPLLDILPLQDCRHHCDIVLILFEKWSLTFHRKDVIPIFCYLRHWHRFIISTFAWQSIFLVDSILIWFGELVPYTPSYDVNTILSRLHSYNISMESKHLFAII